MEIVDIRRFLTNTNYTINIAGVVNQSPGGEERRVAPL